MNLEAAGCYQALLTHDARFDGAFFVGVSTTGIYCRTVCTAKTPRPENCTFHPSAAAAERAGFRPCLRCRPELAPGNARIDSVSRLAATAASRIEDGILGNMRIEELAAELKISGRHLRRVVECEYGVSPVELAQTQRLLLAKRLLTDTSLPITEVAFASGFSSLRRFNALFRERYHLSPTALRGSRVSRTLPVTLQCELAYRPPMDWNSLLAFLAGRAAAGVEVVEGDRYLRTLRCGNHQGWIVVEPLKQKHSVRIEISPALAASLPSTLAGVKRVFDLNAEPLSIAAHLGPLAAPHPGLRVPGAFDGFEVAVRAILGQQITVKAATTLAGRFANAFGETIETPLEKLTHLSPTADRVASATSREMSTLGITPARATSILTLARAMTEGKIILRQGVDVERTIAQLKELPGIGEWTAQYIAMRALSWPDAFPHTDLGIYRALGESNPKRVLESGRAWQPWRAYAAMHLWKSLETQI